MSDVSSRQSVVSRELVLDEQIRQLYGGSYLSLGITLISAIILAYFQWPVIEHQVIWLWLISVWGITTGRLVLTWQFQRFVKSNSGYTSWGNYFQTGVLLAGVSWGSASYFLFPVNEIAHQALLAVILAGMSAGAVAVLSARWAAVILFLVPSLLPLSIQFLTIDDPRFKLLGFVVIVFLFIMLSSAKRNHENILTAIIAGIEKQTNEALNRSREIFQDMVKNVPGFVYQYKLDADGKQSFPYMSPSVYDMLGTTAQEIMRDSAVIFDLIHRDDRSLLEESIIESVNSMQRWSFEGRFVNKKSKEVVWFRGSSQPRKNEDGSILWNGLLVDITSEKRSAQDFKTILDQMLDTFYRTDVDGNLLMVSPSVEGLLGYRPQELLGTQLADLYVEPEGRIKFTQSLKNSNGLIKDYEAPLKHRDGHEVWVSTNAHYYKDHEGVIAGVEGLTRDISERRQAEQELESYHQHLEELVTERATQLKKSESRLNHLLTSSPIVIYSCEAFGEFAATYCSDTMKDVFGYEPAEFTETPGFWVNGIHRDDRERVLVDMGNVFTTGWHEHEYRFRMPGGSYRWVYDEFRLIRDDKNEPLEIIGCWIDIDDRKKIQQELEYSEERFRSLVENATDAIFVHTPQGKFHDVNRWACESLGYSREELLTMTVADIEVGADTDKLVTAWPVLQQGEVLTIDGMHRRKDGSTFPVEVNISMITMRGESCVIALARDITQRKQTEGQLKEVNKELEAFAYSVSHDLRAPLRSINGFCNILLEEYSETMDEDALMYMRRIVGASNKMSDLIDDLLQLSRISRREVKSEIFNLSDMVENTIKSLQSSDTSRKVEIEVQPDLMVRGDRGLFSIVVSNLLSNAWKYSSKKEKTVIKFRARPQDGNIVYSICDHGAGFNMDYIKKLFLPFQRLHPEKEFDGNGIGLATVQRIIHRHGGKIWAESEEGEGACFFFTLQ